MNQIMIIDNQWIVSMYDHLHPEPWWPLNFRTTTIHDIWVIDEVASVSSSAFGRQFTVCWFLCLFWINIARLPQLSWSSSFFLISLTYHKQFAKSQPCAPGLSREWYSWTHGSMQHDSCHTDRFVLHIDRSFYNSCDITHLSFISQFHH
jgi:hypothetical protein